MRTAAPQAGALRPQRPSHPSSGARELLHRRLRRRTGPRDATPGSTDSPRPRVPLNSRAAQLGRRDIATWAREKHQGTGPHPGRRRRAATPTTNAGPPPPPNQPPCWPSRTSPTYPTPPCPVKISGSGPLDSGLTLPRSCSGQSSQGGHGCRRDARPVMQRTILASTIAPRARCHCRAPAIRPPTGTTHRHAASSLFARREAVRDGGDLYGPL